jgi:hypothetical protein
MVEEGQNVLSSRRILRPAVTPALPGCLQLSSKECLRFDTGLGPTTRLVGRPYSLDSFAQTAREKVAEKTNFLPPPRPGR